MPTKIVLRDISRDTHYKITMASTYNAETMKDFIVRAVKYYIASHSIPRMVLTHPVQAPLDLQGWLLEHPSVPLSVFTAPNGSVYTTDQLIELGKLSVLNNSTIPTQTKVEA